MQYLDPKQFATVQGTVVHIIICYISDNQGNTGRGVHIGLPLHNQKIKVGNSPGTSPGFQIQLMLNEGQ